MADGNMSPENSVIGKDVLHTPNLPHAVPVAPTPEPRVTRRGFLKGFLGAIGLTAFGWGAAKLAERALNSPEESIEKGKQIGEQHQKSGHVTTPEPATSTSTLPPTEKPRIWETPSGGVTKTPGIPEDKISNT